DGTRNPAHAATPDSVVETVGTPCHNGGDRAYYDPTAQQEVMMAFTAMLSELYGACRRKVGADELPTKAAAEAVVIEGTRFRSIDGRFPARGDEGRDDHRLPGLRQPHSGARPDGKNIRKNIRQEKVGAGSCDATRRDAHLAQLHDPRRQFRLGRAGS